MAYVVFFTLFAMYVEENNLTLLPCEDPTIPLDDADLLAVGRLLRVC